MILVARDFPTSDGPAPITYVTTTGSIYELEQFRRQVGAPKAALRKRPLCERDCLLLRGQPRYRALNIAMRDGGKAVRLFGNPRALLRYLRLNEPRTVAS